LTTVGILNVKSIIDTVPLSLAATTAYFPSAVIAGLAPGFLPTGTTAFIVNGDVVKSIILRTYGPNKHYL